MKLFFYRGPIPNFGDELNNFLMPKVFPDFFDDDPSKLFLGIGSVIFDWHPAQSTKIVFGSGYAGYTSLPKIDENWRFYCVRGPRTASACALDASKVAADSAVLINRFVPPAPRTTPISFMPHWESIARGQWQRACELAGIAFIDPRSSVEEVLAKLQTTQLLVTEAMHGAIVADALRVPWVAVRPFHPAHVTKWSDWSEALGIKLNFAELNPSTLLETKPMMGKVHWRLKRVIRKLGQLSCDRILTEWAAGSLLKAAKAAPNMSSDIALSVALDRLTESADQIKRDFAR